MDYWKKIRSTSIYLCKSYVFCLKYKMEKKMEIFLKIGIFWVTVWKPH